MNECPLTKCQVKRSRLTPIYSCGPPSARAAKPQPSRLLEERSPPYAIPFADGSPAVQTIRKASGRIPDKPEICRTESGRRADSAGQAAIRKGGAGRLVEKTPSLSLAA
jgi:hypothetical protein